MGPWRCPAPTGRWGGRLGEGGANCGSRGGGDPHGGEYSAVPPCPQGPEVEYCLNAIPMGGYVAFPDDELAALALEREEKDRKDKQQGDKKGDKEGGSALAAEGAAEKATPSAPPLDPSDPNLLKNRPIPQRALVISAGVLANLAFAYLVLLAQVGACVVRSMACGWCGQVWG